MSQRALRRLVFAAGALLAPFPLLAFGPGDTTAAQSLMLAGIALAFGAFETFAGVTKQLAALFLAQALVYGALVWLAAWALARLLSRLSPRLRTSLAAAALGVALALASLAPIYQTPFAASDAHSRWWELYR